MTEEQLQREVEKMCDDLGLLHWHDNFSRRNRPGFPDLVIVGTVGVLFAELKSADGRLKPAQREWCVRLRAAGQHYRLWRPADLESGEIWETLRWL